MTQVKKFLFFLILIGFLRIGVEAVAAETSVLNRGVVTNDYYAASQTVIVEGDINGDAFLAGGNVIVGGTITGNLYVAGGMVNITGSVNNNVRAVGGVVNISGKVGGSVTVIGGTINLTDAAGVVGEVAAVGGRVFISSSTGREVAVLANWLTVDGVVERSVSVLANRVVLSSRAVIAGNVRVLSNNDLQIEPGAQITGTITRQPLGRVSPIEPVPLDLNLLLFRLNFFFRFLNFLGSLLTGYILLWLLPTFTRRTAGRIMKFPWSSFWVGVVIFLATPVVTILLAMTIIGLPLSAVILALYLVAAYLSRFFVWLMIGELLLHFKGRGWSLFLGLIIFEAVLLIPVLGMLIFILTIVFGLGALYYEGRERILKERTAKA